MSNTGEIDNGSSLSVKNDAGKDPSLVGSSSISFDMMDCVETGTGSLPDLVAVPGNPIEILGGSSLSSPKVSSFERSSSLLSPFKEVEKCPSLLSREDCDNVGSSSSSNYLAVVPYCPLILNEDGRCRGAHCGDFKEPENCPSLLSGEDCDNADSSSSSKCLAVVPYRPVILNEDGRCCGVDRSDEKPGCPLQMKGPSSPEKFFDSIEDFDSNDGVLVDFGEGLSIKEETNSSDQCTVNGGRESAWDRYRWGTGWDRRGCDKEREDRRTVSDSMWHCSREESNGWDHYVYNHNGDTTYNRCHFGAGCASLGCDKKREDRRMGSDAMRQCSREESNGWDHYVHNHYGDSTNNGCHFGIGCASLDSTKEIADTRLEKVWPPWKEEPEEKPLSLFPLEQTKYTGVGAGLVNMGNTCFLNAIMQCITHTVPLVKAIRSATHTIPCEGGDGSFCVLSAVHHHIDASLDSSGKTLRPSELVGNLSHISSAFRRLQQEDAHEFLQCLLDRLESCCLHCNGTEDSPSEENNITDLVFGGLLASKLRCCGCGMTTVKYERLIGLSLEIEDVSTLQCALESFTEVEKIEDPKFACEHCKEEVCREKQLMLHKVPPIAALHLKRFKTNGLSIEKIGKHVDFPLELDLKPYTNSSPDDINEDLRYQLYAIVVHNGYSPTSGHYFCYIRSSPNTWHKLDDEQVVKCKEELVLSEAAYILFYAREGTPWFSSLMMELKDQHLEPEIAENSPTSVLDNMESEHTSVPSVSHADSNDVFMTEELVEGSSTKSSCGTMIEAIRIGETNDVVEGISPPDSLWSNVQGGLSTSCDETSGDTSVVYVSASPGLHDREDHVKHIDETCRANIKESDRNDFAGRTVGNNANHPPSPSKYPTPGQTFGGVPEVRSRKTRNHLKVESLVKWKKRSPKRTCKDMKRKSILSSLKHMPFHRRACLMSAVHGSPARKRGRKPCPSKRVSPPASCRSEVPRMSLLS